MVYMIEPQMSQQFCQESSPKTQERVGATYQVARKRAPSLRRATRLVAPVYVAGGLPLTPRPPLPQGERGSYARGDARYFAWAAACSRVCLQLSTTVGFALLCEPVSFVRAAIADGASAESSGLRLPRQEQAKGAGDRNHHGHDLEGERQADLIGDEADGERTDGASGEDESQYRT